MLRQFPQKRLLEGCEAYPSVRTLAACQSGNPAPPGQQQDQHQHETHARPGTRAARQAGPAQGARLPPRCHGPPVIGCTFLIPRAKWWDIFECVDCRRFNWVETPIDPGAMIGDLLHATSAIDPARVKTHPDTAST